MLKMTAITAIKHLIKEVGTHSDALSDSVPKGSKDNNIWSAMNAKKCDTPHGTFNQRFDAIIRLDVLGAGKHTKTLFFLQLGNG
jgi:hypothetical protein